MSFLRKSSIEEKTGGNVAKQSKKHVENHSGNKSKTLGIFQGLLIWVLIPLLFVTMVLLIIANVADVNIFDKAKQLTEELPLVGKKAEKEQDSVLTSDEEFISLNAEIKDKEAQLLSVQEELSKSEEEKTSLQAEIDRLKDEIEQLKIQQTDSKREMKEIVTTFENMSPKSAAPVIIKLSDAEAVQLLANLKPETLASILEKMPAEDAAKYTSLLTK